MDIVCSVRLKDARDVKIMMFVLSARKDSSSKMINVSAFLENIIKKEDALTVRLRDAKNVSPGIFKSVKNV